MNETTFTDQELLGQGFEFFSLGGETRIAIEGPVESIIMSHQLTMLSSALKAYKRIIEDKDSVKSDDKTGYHLSDISSVIIYSISFLEACINLIFESVIRDLNLIKFDKNQKEMFKIIDSIQDKKSIEKISMIDKYRVMHKICFLEDAPIGSKLYQNLILVNKLRNIIIHPKIFGFKKDEEGKRMIRENGELIDSLEKQYSINKRGFMYSDPLLVALNAECAYWVLKSVKDFWNFYCKKFLDAGLISAADTEGEGFFQEVIFDIDTNSEITGGWVLQIRRPTT